MSRSRRAVGQRVTGRSYGYCVGRITRQHNCSRSQSLIDASMHLTDTEDKYSRNIITEPTLRVYLAGIAGVRRDAARYLSSSGCSRPRRFAFVGGSVVGA